MSRRRSRAASTTQSRLRMQQSTRCSFHDHASPCSMRRRDISAIAAASSHLGQAESNLRHGFSIVATWSSALGPRALACVCSPRAAPAGSAARNSSCGKQRALLLCAALPLRAPRCRKPPSRRARRGRRCGCARSCAARAPARRRLERALGKTVLRARSARVSRQCRARLDRCGPGDVRGSTELDARALATLDRTAWRRRPGEAAAAALRGTPGVPAVLPRRSWRAVRRCAATWGPARCCAAGGSRRWNMPEAELDVDTPRTRAPHDCGVRPAGPPYSLVAQLTQPDWPSR